MSTALTPKKIDNALTRATGFVAPGGVGLILPEKVTNRDAADIELFIDVHGNLNTWAKMDWAYSRREFIYSAVEQANPDATPGQLRKLRARVWEQERDRLARKWNMSPAYLDQQLSVVAKWPVDKRVPVPATFDMHLRLKGDESNLEQRHEFLTAYIEQVGENATTAGMLAAWNEMFHDTEGKQVVDQDGNSTGEGGGGSAPQFADIIGLTEEVLSMVEAADEHHVVIPIDDRRLVVTVAEFDGDFVLRYDIEGSA